VEQGCIPSGLSPIHATYGAAIMNRTYGSNVFPDTSHAVADVSSHSGFVFSRSKSGFKRMAGLLAATAALLISVSMQAQTSAYVQTNIISDGAVAAMNTNPLLINPWGVSIGPRLWIDATGSGYSLVDDASGNQSFTVVVPPAASTSTHGTPTGTVYNTNAYIFPMTGGYAQFLFGTLDGTIAGWNANTPEAVTIVNNSAKSASYTDIAVATNANGSYLLAANFAAGTVDVFNSSFASAQLTGSFSDPAIPTGYSPFGIHVLNGMIFVTYAEVNAQGRETVGAGLGYVDAFDTEGNLLQRAISQGNLNAPWGMALAPAGFGGLGGDILVGNFGDGVINAYDPTTFALKGQVTDASGNPIANPGLWEIFFGANGVGDPNTLYFAAGINNEKDGLFGSIAVSQAASAANFTFQTSASSITVTAAQPGTVNLSLASMDGFTGAVALSCSGQPANVTCTFNPGSVTLSSTGTATVAVSVAEVTAPGGTNPYESGRLSQSRMGLSLAFLAPAALLGFVGFRRRSRVLRAFLLTAAVGCLTWAASGCGSSSSPVSSSGGTPTTVQMTINATAGAITHSVPVTLSLQ
jgi:uncharacterized protein (TIGR03118 family)